MGYVDISERNPRIINANALTQLPIRLRTTPQHGVESERQNPSICPDFVTDITKLYGAV